jgi:hypothetical protein
MGGGCGKKRLKKSYPQAAGAQAKFKLLEQAMLDELDRVKNAHSDSHLMLGCLRAQAGLVRNPSESSRLLLMPTPINGCAQTAPRQREVPEKALTDVVCTRSSSQVCEMPSLSFASPTHQTAAPSRTGGDTIALRNFIAAARSASALFRRTPPHSVASASRKLDHQFGGA